MKRYLSVLVAAIILCAEFVFPICAVDYSTLGEKTTVGSITYYTDKEGWASAPISASGITWVHVEYEGVKTWFGVGNVVGAPENAIFKVRIISMRDVDDKYYSRITDTSRMIESDHEKYLDIQITYPDGVIYTGDLIADYYIELGDEFDRNEIDELFEDEQVSVKILYNQSLETESIDVAQISYGPKIADASSENSETETIQTTDMAEENSSLVWQIVTVAQAVVIIGLIAFIVVDKRKRIN